jgi:hypothetical protein
MAAAVKGFGLDVLENTVVQRVQELADGGDSLPD